MVINKNVNIYAVNLQILTEKEAETLRDEVNSTVSNKINITCEIP
jgi:hypothetical protein